jgi:hypothetical protein
VTQTQSTAQRFNGTGISRLSVKRTCLSDYGGIEPQINLTTRIAHGSFALSVNRKPPEVKAITTLAIQGC